MELGNLVSNYIDVVAVTLFGIGFSLLLFNKNLIKNQLFIRFSKKKMNKLYKNKKIIIISKHFHIQ